jgi:hypothetical protein
VSESLKAPRSEYETLRFLNRASEVNRDGAGSNGLRLRAGPS